MKNHSCHPGCTNGLSNVCGTSLDLNDLNFAESRNHLLYVNKVYSKGQGVASPLVFQMITAPATFQTQLLLSPLRSPETDNLCEEILGAECSCNRRGRDRERDCWGNVINSNTNNNCNCNCNCNCGSVLGASTCQLNENSVFEVLRSRVLVTAFGLENPTCLSPNQVTIDGYPVDSLYNFDGSYEASINSILPNITKDVCAENNLPTKAFFLISCVGPWVYQAEFVIEGTVNTNGTICCFRATFQTFSPCPICANIPVANISVPKISIPCASGGMIPRIVFDFDAQMSLLNPTIRLITDANDVLHPILETSVAVEPSVEVQVLKQALLCINACEALFPCDGTESEEEAAEEEEDLDQECQCGSRNGNQVGGAGSNRPSGSCGGCGTNNRNNSVRGTNSFCSSCFRGF